MLRAAGRELLQAYRDKKKATGKNDSQERSSVLTLSRYPESTHLLLELPHKKTRDPKIRVELKGAGKRVG